MIWPGRHALWAALKRGNQQINESGSDFRKHKNETYAAKQLRGSFCVLVNRYQKTVACFKNLDCEFDSLFHRVFAKPLCEPELSSRRC